MRLVQLGAEPTKVGADVRAALSSFGEGDEMLGGVAIIGATPPDDHQPVDAIIVLPRGVIIVVGVDLPEPALTLQAPLQTPWTVDGWPLVRAEGEVNPGFEALESASALATSLQARDVEPLPVGTIVAVGPSVDQVTQPTTDLHRGVRVVHPSAESILAAARELATYQQRCPVEPARQVLKVLAQDAADLATGELTAEGFPVFAESDPASADTALISKIDDTAEATSPSIRLPPLDAAQRRAILLAAMVRRAKRRAAALAALPQQTKLIALAAVVAVVCAIVALVAVSGSTRTVAVPPPAPPIRIDGVDFVRRLSQHDVNCAQHSIGDIQTWFQRQPCAGLTRQDFSTTVSGRPAVVAVAVVDLADPAGAAKLREELDTAGSGGIVDLVAEGHRWDGAPSSLAGSAEAVEQDGKQVRLVQTVWVQGGSQPADIELRSLSERGLRLPASG